MKKPVKVTITGAAGHIGYALAFRVASGEMFGPDQPVTLRLLEIPQALGSLNGVGMELEDCAFPLLHDIVLTDDPSIGFRETDYALLIGAKPRSKCVRSELQCSCDGIDGRAVAQQVGRLLHEGAPGRL